MWFGLLIGVGICILAGALAAGILWWINRTTDRGMFYSIAPPLALVAIIVIGTCGIAFGVGK